jgi:O-antigen/teichoic acid export membrane protein
MSRLRRMAHNVASSYAALAAASLFSLALVPVALHYLGAESGHFALWLLMSTITGYMSLIDLGMSSSVARLLIDYKDRRDEGEYGSLIKTGGLVLWVQGGIILAAGVSLAPVLAWGLKIDPALRGEFVRLLGWQSGSVALGFALRIFGHVLTAHQRNDLQNYSQISSLAVNFCLMWLFFRLGCGVLSLAWASLLSALYSGLFCLGAVVRLRLLPARGAWGRVSAARFRELFSYGQAIFLVALGTQMIMASQILIIQRTLGSLAATLWGLGTRAFFLLSQIIWRIADMAAPAFSEMIVRGERQKLQARYREVAMLTGALSGFMAVGFALCNSVFVTVWTHGRIAWPAGNDVALAFWMVVMALIHCHNGFVLLTKQIGFMRYVYFIEGVTFVALALALAPWGGIPAVIGCSIGCSCLFSGAYGIFRIASYFGVARREVLLRWSGLLAATIVRCVPVALLAWFVARPIESPAWRLAVLAIVFGVLGGLMFLRFGLPASFQREVSTRAPQLILPFIRRVIPLH